jgi:hypothetical protein
VSVSGLYWKTITVGIGLARSTETMAPFSKRGEMGDAGHGQKADCGTHLAAEMDFERTWTVGCEENLLGGPDAAMGFGRWANRRVRIASWLRQGRGCCAPLAGKLGAGPRPGGELHPADECRHP